MDLDRLAGVPVPVDEQAVERELAEHLGDHVEGPRPEPWRITSLGAADWALRRYADAAQREQAYRDEIALWDAARRRVAQAAAWFDARLREWAIEQRTPQRRSFGLAHGTIATREAKAKPIVVDEPAVIAWARGRDGYADAVKVTTSFLISQAPVEVRQLVVAMCATDKSTGETQRISVQPEQLDEARLAALRERMGDGYVVEPELAAFVLDKSTGQIVPGLDVAPGKITASITPLGL